MVRKLQLKDQHSHNVLARCNGDEYGRGVGLCGKSVGKFVAVIGKWIQAKWAEPT